MEERLLLQDDFVGRLERRRKIVVDDPVALKDACVRSLDINAVIEGVRQSALPCMAEHELVG